MDMFAAQTDEREAFEADEEAQWAPSIISRHNSRS
jgi:hypothetical protein